MGPLGTRSIKSRAINKNSTSNTDDFPPLTDECNNTATVDEPFAETVSCEDNDAFDTQVVNFDNETQPVDLCEDTQILYLAGETQVMDDYDLDEHMDTQLLDVSDNENESGDQSTERPQHSHSPNESLGRSSVETNAGEEKRIHACNQDDTRAKAETLPDNAVQSSGSLGKGFTAIRTASLRSAGLAAQKKVSMNAYHGSFSTEIGGKTSNFQCENDYDGISDAETVDLENDGETDGEERSNGFKSKVARSLAREFFMEEVVSAEGCDNGRCSEMTRQAQLPACDNEVVGLSYLDSQEPGELSQANALEFVDRFLKINVFESDHDITNQNTTGEIVSPHTIAKGPQSCAQQAKRRSLLVGPTVFDWDDNHEDEGGGEFFTKKKEILFGTSCSAHNCRSYVKPRNSQLRGANGGQSLGKSKNERGCQNIHDKNMGLAHSYPTMVKRRNTNQPEGPHEKDYDYLDPQEGSPSCDGEVLAGAPNGQSIGMLDVGIDTQMAAEAMEALSTGGALATNNDSNGIEDRQNLSEKEAAKNAVKSSVSKSGTIKSTRTTRAAMKSSKSSVARRTRSQCAVEDFSIDMVEPILKRRRLHVENVAAVNEKESSDSLVSIDGKEKVCSLECQLNNNVSLSAELRGLQDNASVSAPVARKTRQLKVVNHVNGANYESCGSRLKRQCLDSVQPVKEKTKCKSRSDVDSENLNAIKETLDATTVTDSAMIERPNSKSSSLQLASCRVNRSDKKRPQLRVSVGHEAVLQSISWRTRSKRVARFALNGKVLRSRVVVSSEDDCQLSSKKRQTSSSAKEGGLHTGLEVSPIQVKNASSSASVTPLNSKTPTKAVSPVCVGDGYSTPSCKTKRNLKKEFYSLTASETKYTSPSKGLRQRRDFNCVRVLFSQHLDDDIIKKQKKILSRLGVPVASSISDATHFIADGFVRTRNMLEAIACGKPVVTHLWLESCGQSNCFIDERNFILRDAKKEKELGFSMPNSLVRASHNPLLEGRRVLVTPKVKPSKEIVSGLVKAVRGQATERLCRAMSKDNRIPDDLLVLSCEEDLQECLPLLEKGIAVYSSELLLNGIIAQRLEYERYRIFVDHVKRTRSTLWVKKNGDRFQPVGVAK